MGAAGDIMAGIAARLATLAATKRSSRSSSFSKVLARQHASQAIWRAHSRPPWSSGTSAPEMSRACRITLSPTSILSTATLWENRSTPCTARRWRPTWLSSRPARSGPSSAARSSFPTRPGAACWSFLARRPPCLATALRSVGTGHPKRRPRCGDSLPLLRDAECICIIDVEGSAGRGFMPSDAARYLERHGFDSYQVETYGCCLVEIVAHQNVDLVVGAGAPSFWSPRSPEQLAEALRVPILITA